MNKKRLLPIALSIAVAIVIAILMYITLTTHARYPMSFLDEGWTVSINGKEYTDVTISRLSDIMDKKLERGDKVVLSIDLPSNYEIPGAVLLYRSRYVAFYTYLNDKKIYGFGDQYYNQNKFIGKMYHIISLPTDYAGKKLTIDMRVAEDNPFNTVEPILFGNHDDVAGYLVHSNLFVIASGIFTFLFGVVFVCIALLFANHVSEVKSLLFGSLFCLTMGIWLLCYYNMLSLFFYTMNETFWEYFTMYLLVPFCYVILYHIHDLKGQRVYTALMILSCTMPLVQYAIHFFTNLHLRATLPVYHVDGIIGFGILTYYALKNAKEKSIPASSLMQLTGLFTFCACEVVHLIIYYCGNLLFDSISLISKLIICGGCLFYVICQISTYMIYVTDSYARKQENASLSHLAYADGLTGLANRSKADKLMEELNTAEDDYCIISIDLNGLKIVNDEFGHISGDKYIKDFSKVLVNTFGDQSFCARIGGDEFVVVLRDATSQNINALIERMNSAINVMNALYTEYKRSVATGYAFKHEFESGSSHEVYLLADQRMYDNKRRMHEELGIHARL